MEHRIFASSVKDTPTQAIERIEKEIAKNDGEYQYHKKLSRQARERRDYWQARKELIEAGQLEFANV